MAGTDSEVGAPEGGAGPRLQRGHVGAAGKCRCGSVLELGQEDYEFVSAPDNVRAVVEDRPFCSITCARAFLLETMEFLDRPAAASLLSDGRDAYWGLGLLFLIVEQHHFSGTTPPGVPRVR